MLRELWNSPILFAPLAALLALAAFLAGAVLAAYWVANRGLDLAAARWPGFRSRLERLGTKLRAWSIDRT